MLLHQRPDHPGTTRASARAEEGSRHARRGTALPPQGSPVRRTVVPLKLAELKPHPQQGKLFPAVPEEQIRWLAASIKESGLDHPIEVVPDHSGYMIVAGHCRVEAVRVGLVGPRSTRPSATDLAEQGPLAAEFYMIKDNFLRRQLSPLQRAQLALSLKELAMQRQCDGQPLDRVAKAVIRQTNRRETRSGTCWELAAVRLAACSASWRRPRRCRPFSTWKVEPRTGGANRGAGRRQAAGVAKAIRNGENAAAAVAEDHRHGGGQVGGDDVRLPEAPEGHQRRHRQTRRAHRRDQGP